jgi:hypothetical protein
VTTEVTFDNHPSLSPNVLSARQITPADVGKTLSFDVSAAVAAWRTDPSSNQGLAITATGSPAEVYFVSREGGTPAIIRADNPPVVRDNDVTVAPVGGDYTDPVTAIENALIGDNWCVSRSAQAPCTMHISFGLYPVSRTLEVPELIDVIGTDIRQSVLFALPGVSNAMRVHGSTLRNLSVLNEQPGVDGVAIEVSSGTGQPIVIDHVLARASSPSAATALHAVSAQILGLSIRDSEFTATGIGTGSFVIAVHVVDNNTPTAIARSRLAALGGQFNFGLEWESRQGAGNTTLDSTVVLASGAYAAGVHANADRADLDMINGEVTAIGDEVETVISNGANLNLSLTNMKIVARGTQRGTGILANFNGPELRLNGVSVDATFIGAVLGNHNNAAPLSVEIFGSNLVAGDRALEVTSVSAANPATIRVDESTLRAPTAVSLFSGGDGSFLANVSQLVGAIVNPQAMSIQCVETFDESGRNRRPNCAPQ